VDVGLWSEREGGWLGREREREGGWLGREREREGLSFPQFQFLYHNFLIYLNLFCGFLVRFRLVESVLNQTEIL